MNPKHMEEKFIRFAKSATIVTVSSIFSGMFRTMEDVDVVDLEKLRSVTLSECVVGTLFEGGGRVWWGCV